MMLAILVTGAVAIQVGSNPELVARIFGNTVFMYGVIKLIARYIFQYLKKNIILSLYS
jgi:hypothetical protein